MAPIPGLANNIMLSPRANNNHEADMEREIFIVKLLFGMLIAAFVVFVVCLFYIKWKPKYEEKWKAKLKHKLGDCREKCEGWKKKTGAWHGPKEPSPGGQADRS